MTKLTPALPQGDSNGLLVISRSLVDEPHRVHAVIALIDCKKITTDNDSGEVEPTARIRRIEVITGEDLKLAEQVIRRALEKRTGATTLPLDLEDELDQVFSELRFDAKTGEILSDDADEPEMP